jgi:hypothetical protein
LTVAGKLDTVGSIDATYSVVSRTSTGELHERIYAPHRLTKAGYTDTICSAVSCTSTSELHE